MKWLLDLISKHTGEDGVIDTDALSAEINKVLPTMYVPKDVYNTVAKEKKELETKVSEYENSQLTDEEQRQKIIDEANEEKAKYLKMQSKLKAESILVKGGLTEDDYKDFIDGIVSENEETTINLANSLVTTLSKKIESETATLREEAMKNTQRPNGGDGGDGGNKTTAETLAESIAKNMSSSTEESKRGISAYTGGN